MVTERRIEHRVLQVLLAALGISAVGIGLMIFVLGADRTMFAAESLFNSLLNLTPSLRQPGITSSVDSELRFYSTLWISYGVLLVWIARALVERLRLVPIVAAIFFAGGVGRVISYIVAGPPEPVFFLLMVIELVYPVLLIIPYLRLRKSANPS